MPTRRRLDGLATSRVTWTSCPLATRFRRKGQSPDGSHREVVQLHRVPHAALPRGHPLECAQSRLDICYSLFEGSMGVTGYAVDSSSKLRPIFCRPSST